MNVDVIILARLCLLFDCEKRFEFVLDCDLCVCSARGDPLPLTGP